MTAQDLINGALRLLGVIDPAEGPEAAESAICLSALNSMIDSWSTERLSVPKIDHYEVTTIAGKREYTVGATGDWFLARPIKVYDVRCGEAPVRFEADNGFPLITVTLDYDPAGEKLTLYVLNPLGSVAGLDTVITLGPGYERALRYGLAIEVAPEFHVPVPSEVVAIFDSAKANIQRLNHKPLEMVCELATLTNPWVDIQIG